MGDNALAVYGKVDNPMTFADQMAESVAALISCDVRQGRAMAIQMLCEGLNPMQLQRRYHWIQGRPSMRADAMRAEFRMNYGGDFEIVEATGDAAHIKFTDAKGREYPSKITWQDAQREPWPWKKGCGPGTDKTEPSIANLKDNWATPLSRANMLMARATSSALRYICPELVAGVYTPEEMQDVMTSTAGSEPAEPRKSGSQIVAEQLAQRSTVVSSAVNDADGNEPEADEVEFVVKEAEGGDSATPAATEADPDAPGSITDSVVMDIEFVGNKACGEKWADAKAKALAKRGAQVLRNLSLNQGRELLKNLQTKAREQEQAAKN